MAEQNQNNQELFKMAAQKLGLNQDAVKKAAEDNGENLLNKLSAEDRQKVSEVLSDKELTRQILSSPKAKKLLEKFFGENRNGN